MSSSIRSGQPLMATYSEESIEAQHKGNRARHNRYVRKINSQWEAPPVCSSGPVGQPHERSRLRRGVLARADRAREDTEGNSPAHARLPAGRRRRGPDHQPGAAAARVQHDAADRPPGDGAVGLHHRRRVLLQALDHGAEAAQRQLTRAPGGGRAHRPAAGRAMPSACATARRTIVAAVWATITASPCGGR